jgi:transposase-like protein
VWLYHRFPPGCREVEELMLQRGVVVSYESIRQWCAKFGQVDTNRLRRRRGRPGDKWHLDEVVIRINGTIHVLWRAVDQHRNVLDVLVQSRRNAVAAIKFFRRLLTGRRYAPRVLVTDKLASYGPAHRVLMPAVEHRMATGSAIGQARDCRRHRAAEQVDIADSGAGCPQRTPPRTSGAAAFMTTAQCNCGNINAENTFQETNAA